MDTELLCNPKPRADLPGLWDLYDPHGDLFAEDVTTMQVMHIAHRKGWALPEPSPSGRAGLMRDAGHRPEDFC